MYHQFNVAAAEKYGLREAVVLNHMAFWVIKNQANRKHHYEDKYWTYTSYAALGRIFTYMSPDQARRSVEKLTEQGALVKGNFNRAGFDRTNWYTLSEEAWSLLNGNSQHEQADLPNGKGQTAKGPGNSAEPIPDTNTDTKAYNPYGDFVDVFFNFYREKAGTEYHFQAKDGAAIKKIMAYLDKATQDKTGVNTKENAALHAWQFILLHWDRLEPFLQKQLSLTQINANLVNILPQIRNNNGQKDQRPGPASTADWADRIQNR